ncbi:MarR family winged helix-turn-helix transcriptional regulator [Lutimaribacter marinistellae]|uniref:MarR family winged helix-turn-helix transcriptional regulator n=1 Tax=Lutimaribacter marinistellae TaxID=1820329 RepID=A0ABV7TC02_9RHOB
MSVYSDENLGPYEVPLNRMVTYRLSRLYAKLNAQASRILKETAGLTQAQWRVLVMVDSLGPISSNQIVRSLLIDKGQLSRVLKTMSEKELVTIGHSESDQRSHVISMTEKGRRLFEQARPAMTHRQRTISQALAPEQFDTLLSAFDQIEAAVLDNEDVAA